MRKTYYCVTSAYHDSGRVTAAITMTIDSEEKPADHMTEARDRDIYTEWFDDLDKAKQAVSEARAESSF